MKKVTSTLVLLVLTFGLFAQNIVTNFEDQKKRAVKMEFFSPLTGNTTLGYESYIKDWLSWEAKVGIIGIGTDVNDSNPVGIFLKGGPKFKLNPDFVTSDLKGAHLLGGKYIRPEIAFSQYTESVETFDGINSQTERESFTSIAFLITYGRQYVLADLMTLDYHIGLGYGYSSSDEGRYDYGFATSDPSFPLAFSAGFTIGFLLQ